MAEIIRINSRGADGDGTRRRTSRRGGPAPELRVLDFERQRQREYQAESIEALKALLDLAEKGYVTSMMFWVTGPDFPERSGSTGAYRGDPSALIAAAMRLSAQLALEDAED